MHRTIASLLVFVTFAVAPLASSASIITVPTGLNIGDQYRLAFVTSTTRDATDSDITLYNAFVSGVANGVTQLAALGTTWTAIGSTSSVDARDNTGTNPTVSSGVPVYRLDDTRVADHNADLWDGSIQAGVQIDEGGNNFESVTWTGSIINGTAALSPLGFASPRSGFSPSTGLGWMMDSDAAASTLLPLSAMSGVLTVVPEPSSIAALAAWRWRRPKG